MSDKPHVSVAPVAPRERAGYRRTGALRLNLHRLLWAMTIAIPASTGAADKPAAAAGVVTVDDGRGTIQALYAAFGSLVDEGWILEIIAESQPYGTQRPIPIIALRTPVAGPALWIIAGIHGEEPAGPNAIANVIDEIAATGAQRPMILIPLANPQGYVRNWRYLNMPVWLEHADAQSVGDSSHMLPDPQNPGIPRLAAASSSEADAITRFIADIISEYPPLISLDLHEDNEIDEGYVYSQGSNGADEPLASVAVRVLQDSSIPIKMDGETRFGEVINDGIIGPVTDSSIDELMSSQTIFVDAVPINGPAAPVVLVFETPSAKLTLERRIGAHETLLRNMLSSYLDAR